MLFNEDFAFDSTPRSPSLSSDLTLSTRDTSRSVSPCTATSAYPAPRFSVTDLAASFSNSRLRHDSQICYDSCEAYANMDDDAGWEIPGASDDYLTVSRSRTITQRSHSPSRRMARQASTRLLCSTTHAKDIAALVSQMVDSKEHCNVVASSESVKQSVEAMDDEGYDSGTSAAASRRSSLAVQRSRLDYRRTSDLKTAGGARVCKAVRQKKEVKQRRVRSGESMK
ncbi:hypothetical protein Slin15195_G064960 [Septoria linicola]|uniref:Uncharacterized protein n=1 Tax=Septoria linicola TaxID=215465 RepID=A0A9Q9EKE1_9PEZI|nr:hypothetical protein Slin14017_G115300 [Septoria linicola]USW53177.1 hypothetical protein Slin15195_G064960 [Septoria linicola]